MSSPVPYINIHTHYPAQSDEVCVVNNRFGYDPEIYSSSAFSIGIHPWDAALNTDQDNLKKWVLHPDCVAIGECGLDKLKGPDLEIQKTIFRAQLELALTHHKPVIIHCVKAFDELIQVCEPYMDKLSLIIHGYNKSAQLAQQLIAKGFYLSVGMSLLKKEEYDLSAIPLKKLFLETDTQDAIPIGDVYKTAALKLNLDLDVLKEKIYSNFAEIRLLNK